VRGPNLDEVEGNMDLDDPRLWGDPGASLDELDDLRQRAERAEALLEIKDAEIADLREEVAELTDEIEGRQRGSLFREVRPGLFARTEQS
jgi:predicted  nucleic acid-binding Zn-ribbon protein